jgi:hypothetical protein
VEPSVKFEVIGSLSLEGIVGPWSLSCFLFHSQLLGKKLHHKLCRRMYCLTTDLKAMGPPSVDGNIHNYEPK